jgi:hypothetical protein
LPIATASNTPGIELEARTACPVLPRTNTVRSPLARLVATTANGFFILSRVRPPTRSLT